MQFNLFGIKLAIDTTEARDRLSAASIDREVNRIIRAEERAEMVKARRAQVEIELETRRQLVQQRLAETRAKLEAAKTDSEISAAIKEGNAA